MMRVMPHLLARANEAVLEAQWLRQEGRALRMEAAIRAGELGETIVRATRAAKQRQREFEPDRQTAEEADCADQSQATLTPETPA